MDCDRYHLYHASWAYSVRGLASRSDGGQGLPGLFIGYGLLAGLLFALWRGYGWARWLLFGLCVIGSLWIVLLAFESPSVFVISRAIHLIIVALLLSATPSVASFLAAQRAAGSSAPTPTPTPTPTPLPTPTPTPTPSPTVTPTPGPITLSAQGKKVGGINTVHLKWRQATSANVDVNRDGVVIATTPNDGLYDDSTGHHRLG